jgi:2-iminobutanoate/2-iminopropanoate deaminase
MIVKPTGKNRTEMRKEVIKSPNTPPPSGPYSVGIRAGDFIFIAGHGSNDVKTGKFIGNTIEEQTTKTIENIQGVLEAAGASLSDVVKVTVYLSDRKNWARMNTVYKEFFREDPPVRTAVQVEMDTLIEIDAIAYKPVG